MARLTDEEVTTLIKAAIMEIEKFVAETGDYRFDGLEVNLRDYLEDLTGHRTTDGIDLP